jgi:hypothetical protein
MTAIHVAAALTMALQASALHEGTKPDGVRGVVPARTTVSCLPVPSQIRDGALRDRPVMTQTKAPEPRTLDKGDQSNIDSPRQVVVRTEAEWTALWRQHTPDRPMPKVDFSREMVVGMMIGSRPTAGYSIDIVSTIEANGVLHVRYRETRPGRGTITAQILTSPYHLVAVPRSTATDVRFEPIS